MGLSLSVLITIILLLPGAAFVFAAPRLHNQSKPAGPLDQYVSFNLALMICVSAGLHALFYWLRVHKVEAHGGLVPDLHAAFALLAGAIDKPDGIRAINQIQQHPVAIPAYLFGLTSLGWSLGVVWNRVVLDEQDHASWYDLLRPEDVAFVWLTAEIAIGKETYLYAGKVDDFHLSKDGALDRVSLVGALRKKMDFVDGRSDGTPLNGWQAIPGELCVIQLKNNNTINLDYWFLGEGTGETEADPVPDDDDDANG